MNVYATSKLSDVNGHWAQKEIDTFIRSNYISGYPDGTFKPNNSISRAEFVKIFNKVFGLTSADGNTFVDVPNDHWAKDEIDIAVTNGVCQGTSATTFDPEAPITREQAAKMIANYKKISDNNHNKLNTYLDNNTVSDWAKDSVEGVIEKGFMTGNEYKFNPKNNITRAEAVVTIGRADGIFELATSPEVPDINFKIPNISFAKEQSIKVIGYGKAIGGTGLNMNEIEGQIYAKYGDPKLGAHTYNSRNQAQYDKSVNWAKEKIKTVQFRLQPSWVYLQYYLNGGTENSFIDPILKQNGVNSTYGDWLNENKYLIIGLTKNLINVQDAEQLMIYRSVMSHVDKYLKHNPVPDDIPWTKLSAYDVIFNGISSVYGMAHLGSLIGDIIGMNTIVASDWFDNQDVSILVGNYWWKNGLVPTLNKTDNPFNEYDNVMSAPTYNLEAFYPPTFDL